MGASPRDTVQKGATAIAALVAVAVGLLAPGASARHLRPGGEILYTLTVTFRGEEDVRAETTTPFEVFGPVHVPAGYLTGEAHRRTQFVATSVRPFAIVRSASAAGTVYRFQAPVSGTLDHVGTGRSAGNIVGCLVPFTEKSAVKRVEGTVSLPGWHKSPAPLSLTVGPTSSRDAVVMTTSAACGRPAGSTRTSSLLPQHARWTGPIGPVQTTAFDLGKHYGDAFTVEYRLGQKRVLGPDITAGHVRTVAVRSYVWTLTFTPVTKKATRERWQVEIRGRSRSSIAGSSAGPAAGVWVDWLNRTVLELENGAIVSAAGKVVVEGIHTFSEPPGVFQVTARTATRSAYPLLKAAGRVGQLVELNLYDRRDRHQYRVSLSYRLVGPQALDLLRAAGIPKPEDVYGRLVGRTVSPAPYYVPVPSSARLVFVLRPGLQHREPDSYNSELPCTISGLPESGCFLTRGGETITVRKLT